jgi:hypothetical protein
VKPSKVPRTIEQREVREQKRIRKVGVVKILIMNPAKGQRLDTEGGYGKLEMDRKIYNKKYILHRP